MVWFSRRAPERGSMTHRSTTIFQAENQNQSKTSPGVGGVGFVIFEIGSAGRAGAFAPPTAARFMERPEKVITKPSAVRPELGRRDTESPDMFPLCASAPLWPIIEPLLCRNRSKSDDGGNAVSAPKQKTAPVLKCQVVQKRCSFAAPRRSGTETGPFPVRYRGGGIRFPDDRGGVEATRRVKLDRRRKIQIGKNR